MATVYAPCESCGRMPEDGKPLCQGCGAPVVARRIRAVIPADSFGGLDAQVAGLLLNEDVSGEAIIEAVEE